MWIFGVADPVRIVWSSIPDARVFVCAGKFLFMIDSVWSIFSGQPLSCLFIDRPGAPVRSCDGV